MPVHSPSQDDADTMADADYDPHRVDAYADHLTEVNKVRQVLASEDIVNAQGMLLVRRGQPISKEMVARIVQFKLLRPLESSVDISEALTQAKILQSMEAMLADDDVRAVYDRLRVRDEIERCCAFLFKFPILVQKLTVLSLQMPGEYEKALAVAWTGLIAALQLKLTAAERANLFIAALMHDIGMLHIPAAIANKTGDLTAQEWRAVKSHVIIGQKILQQIDHLPAAIATTVLEHHEIGDGSGYPFSRFGSELSLSGQIVGLLDSAFAVYLHKLLPRKLGSRYLLPMLQVNSHIHHRDVCNVMIQMLRAFRQQPGKLIIEAKGSTAFIAAMAENHSFLKAYHIHLIRLVEPLRPDGERPQLRAAVRVLDHLETLLRRSGLLADDYFAEIEAYTLADLEDIHLLLQELQWQMVRLTRVLHGIADGAPLTEPVRAALQQGLANLPALKAR